jgi:adenylate kinase
MPPKIIIYGAPGAGKDTQGARLAERLGIPFFSAGGLLRAEVAAETDIGKKIQQILENGEVVPEEFGGRFFMRRKILSPEIQVSGYVEDGYPRSLELLRDFLSWERPSLIIHLVVPDAVARERIMKRGRDDGSERATDNRLDRYHGLVEPVCEYWKTETDVPYVEIDGTGTPERITEQIVSIIYQSNRRPRSR